MPLFGYARVSTSDQSLDRQVDELRAHGCERVFAEVASGNRGAHRPQWDACLTHLSASDTLVVSELSRLGRNTGDLGRLLDELDDRGIALQILNLGIDTRTPSGRLIFAVVGAVAAMERECSSNALSPGWRPREPVAGSAAQLHRGPAARSAAALRKRAAHRRADRPRGRREQQHGLPVPRSVRRDCEVERLVLAGVQHVGRPDGVTAS